MDLQQGEDSQDQGEHGGDTIMEETPRAKDLTAEKEAEATANDASQAAKDKTTEAEATANDASLSTKASFSSTEADQASGKAAYEALAHASSTNLEQGLVNVKQPRKIGAPPRPRVSAAEAARIAAASAGAALELRNPHVLMTVADKMASSANVFATNARTNATMMKGTAQVTYSLH